MATNVGNPDTKERLMGIMALREAVEANDVELCRSLIAAGVDVDEPAAWTPLQEACNRGTLDLARLMVRAGANVNTGPMTPFILAVETGDLELCQYLIDVGADINRGDSYGNTALMRSAKRGNVPMCAFLVEHGAEVNAIDDNGYTALLLAVSLDQLDAVKFLLQAGADTDTLRSCERLPLATGFQLAVRLGSIKVVEHYLLERGEDPAQRTASGRTMRQLAGKHEHVKQLLQSVEVVAAVERSCGSVQSNVEASVRAAQGAAPI
jgi:ankyrin repeat protein